MLRDYTFTEGRGLLVMEKLDARLDDWLGEPRTEEEISQVATEIKEAITAIHEAGACHGDLALFNIGLISDRIVVFDFDDSSVEGSHILVDATRVLMETFQSTQSDGTHSCESGNLTLLRKELKSWVIGLLQEEELIDGETLTAALTEQLWFDVYREYCEAVGLPVLDED